MLSRVCHRAFHQLVNSVSATTSARVCIARAGLQSQCVQGLVRTAVQSSMLAPTSTHTVSGAALVQPMQSRHFSLAINNLTDLPGAKKEGARVGRGRSSGIGKTCGRGIKGRGARAGRFGKPRHEGGQSALWRRSPKRGFRNNINRKPLHPVALPDLVSWIAAGRIDASKTITMKDIYDSGLSGRFENGIKLLSGGNARIVDRLPFPIHIEVSHCSAPVKEAIEQAGGSVKFVYYSRLGLRNLLKPGSLNFEVKPSVPKPKQIIRYELQTVGPEGRAQVFETLRSRIQRKIWKKK